MNHNQRLGDILFGTAYRDKVEQDEIGEMAFYMSWHESMHPAVVLEHVVKEAARRYRNKEGDSR